VDIPLVELLVLAVICEKALHLCKRALHLCKKALDHFSHVIYGLSPPVDCDLSKTM